MKALETGNLPEVDIHTPFRELLQHKVFAVRWMLKYITNGATAVAMARCGYLFRDIPTLLLSRHMLVMLMIMMRMCVSWIFYFRPFYNV